MSEPSGSVATEDRLKAPTSKGDSGASRRQSSARSKGNRTTKGTLQRDVVENELDKARAALTELRDKIADGDEVTGRQLADAEASVELAELRLAAVDEHERRRQQQQREQLADELRRTAKELSQDDARLPIHQAGQDVAAALDALFKACADFNGRRDQLEAAAASLDLSRLATPPHAEPQSTAIQLLCEATDRHGGSTGVVDRRDIYYRVRDLRPPPGSPPHRDATPTT